MQEHDWATVVGAATRAPSIHNTQPWRFTASDGRLEIYLDESRALPVLDPTRRQQVISCGIVAEFAVVALADAGTAAEVDVLPDPGNPDHLATVRVTGPHDSADEDRAMAAAIAERHTVRSPFLPRAVSAELIEQLRAEAGAFGIWFKQITRSEEEVATVFLISRAEEIEQGDPAYLAELQSWLRSDSSPDGVPVGAVPSDDPHGRASNWLIRDFVVGNREEQHLFRPGGDPDAPPPEVERPTVVLMGTEGDDREAWVSSGRALGRVLLRATAAGLAASPLTQALDWPATRTQLQSRLSLVGHPQMLIRLGYPPQGPTGVVSGRRPVEEVLQVRPPS